MKVIHLRSQTYGSHQCLVDDEDYEWLTGGFVLYAHRVRKRYYVDCYEKGVAHGSKHKRLVHRVIYARHHGLADEEELDHEDGNSLNNQKRNLRIASSSQNNHNRRKFTANESRYRGVRSRKRKGGGWYANIKKDLRSIRIGAFEIERDAAIAYDIAAKRLFGAFALLNVPEATEAEIARVEDLIRRPKRELGTLSQYFGVTFNKSDGYWHFTVRVRGMKTVYGTRFQSEFEAALARDAYIDQHGLSLRKSLADYDPLAA